MRRGVMEQMVSLISLGDGSTLSLDFTTGVLDSRLTFTRGTTATFINSQGLVQYANANIIRQSENCGSWSGAQNITPTADAAIAPNGTQTADQLNLLASSYRYQVTSTTYAVGQQYVGSIWMRTVSGTASVGFRIANSVTGANSAIATCSVTETWQRFTTPAFTLSDSANRVIDIGIDQRSIVSGPNVAANIYVWGLQLQPGTSAGEYLPTTTTENLNVPRFDHDPTTLAPRGLLVEGQSVNSVNWSESFATSGSGTLWNYNTYVTRNATQITGPDGGTSAYQFNETTDNQIHRISTSVTGSAGAISISVWAKVLDTNAPRRLYVNALNYMGAGALFDLDPAVQTGASGSAVATSGTAANRAGTWVKYPNNWYRVTLVGTYVTNQTMYLQINRASSTTASDDTFAGSTSNGLALWGCQVEQGSGASSYIPTGASQATRNADICTMNDITALNYSTTNGTMLYVGRFTQINSSSFPTRAGFQQAGGNNPGFEIFTNGSLIFSAARSAPANPERSTTITTNSSIKFATAFDASLASNEVTICLNGGTVLGSSATGLTATYAPTIFALGRAGYELFYPSGTIAQVKYWPTTLPNAQLQSLTT
jgi:hypothetical protein